MTATSRKNLTLAWIAALAVLLPLLGGGKAGAGDMFDMDVLFTSDIHGHIDRGEATFLNPNFPPPLGGGASAAAYIKVARENAEAAGRPLFLFDSGDIFQGTPVGMFTQGTTVMQWMNAMGYTAMAVGNHEFDRGWENVKRLAGLAQFPVLAANLYSTDTGKKVDWVGDFVILQAEGVKIGVVGYVTESTANMSFGDNVKGLEFKPIHELLPGHIRHLREDLKCDLVFVLMHAGLPYKPEMEQEYRRMKEREAAGGMPHWGMNAMELANTIPGIDAIFAGHTHQGYDQPWQDPINHTMIFEPYANGSSLGHVTFHLDRATKQIVGYDTHFDRGVLLTLFEEDVWPDPVVADTIAAEVALAEAGLDEVVGETEVLLPRGSANNALMGFVMVDSYRIEMNADFAMQNTGGVRADIPVGRITERDILEVSPFDNSMVIVQMTGAFVDSLLEDKLRGNGGGIFFSGGKVRYDPSRPDGDRIVSFLDLDGNPIDPQKTYKVAMTNYLAEGNSGMWRLREIPSEKILYTGRLDREVLSDYIRHMKVLKPANDGRWVKVEGSSE